MSDPNDSGPTPMGLYDRPERSQLSTAEVIAFALSLLWLLGAGVFFLVMGSPEEGGTSFDSLRFVMTMLAVFMPVAMIWVAATAARSSRVMREESQRLQTAIDAIRQAYLAQNQSGTTTPAPSVARKLEEIAAATRKTETALATFTSSRERGSSPIRAAAVVPATEDQAPLPLENVSSDDGTPPLSRADFIRAMHFPETADDEEGFTALRKALKDRKAAQLIQAAQDVLTLLSQEGIYMDDLRPDMARPEIWRQFAQGLRGRTISSLGGVRDRSSLALTAGRMRQDPIFRDAAHHFLRRFDQTFQEFEQGATDSEISELSDTRTARAFMLLGRVAGMFT